MHVLYLTCPHCNHTGTTRDARAIQCHMSVTPFRVRCSKCGISGMSHEFKRSLTFDKALNPYRQDQRLES